MSDSTRAIDRDAFRFLVSPYHPDSLRYPTAPVSTPKERLRHALTWNVFKTLEQVSPGLWMRLLIARSVGLPDHYDSAPHIVKAVCWPSLKPAPSTVLRRGRPHALQVSAVVDADDTVVTFLTPGPHELLDRVLSDTAVDGLVNVAEATAWLAGTRSAYVSVVLPLESDTPEWVDRIRRRGQRAHRVLLANARGPANLKGIGAVTWASLHDLLAEVAASPFTPESERRCVQDTVGWMQERLGPVYGGRQKLA